MAQVVLPLSAHKRHKKRHEQAQPLLVRTNQAEFSINQDILGYANQVNKELNSFNDTFFNPQFLKKAHKLSSWASTEGQQFVLQGATQTVHGTYFNRGSDTLVIVGPGFNNKHEQMAGCIKLFPDYDLVFFDFPGHGRAQRQPSTFQGKLSRFFADIDITSVSFGPAEVETILTAITHFKGQKEYTKLVGVGFCYSVMFLVQAGAQWATIHQTPLFDKLILDSSWNSYDQLVKHLPLLKVNSLGVPFLTRFFNTNWAKDNFLWAAQKVVGVPFDQLAPLTFYSPQLVGTDILFIQSCKDIAISSEEFEKVWDSFAHIEHKCVLFTHNEHVRNHFAQKELFKFASELFIEKPFNEFYAVVAGQKKIQ